jgi:hippurate hydrolase
LFDRFPCNHVYGMHNRPGLPVGRFTTGQGARMAGGAFFDIAITGKGAHGANPHHGIDPVVVACHLGTALQSIVSRNVAASDTAVLSITRIQSGDAYNVIPHSAILAGTVRTLKPEVMEAIKENMTRLSTSLAAGFGAEATVDFRLLFAPLVNDAEESVAYGDAAAELVGEENVRRDAPPGMGSEDFSFMLEQVPGAHINLGNGDSAALHNHLYDFNDETIPYGVALYAAITEKKLPKGLQD